MYFLSRGETIRSLEPRTVNMLGDPDDFKVSGEAISGLIKGCKPLLSDAYAIRREDILFAYGGLRPLVEDRTTDVYHSSRRYEIYDHAADGLEGLITVEGGKYTTSRNLAEQVMKIVEKKVEASIQGNAGRGLCT